MSRFRYRAVGAEGQIVTGEIDAASAQDVDGRLGRVGLELLAASPVGNGLKLPGRSSTLGRVELIQFFMQLESLLRAGVPILDTLTDLRDSSDSAAVRQLATDLVDRIETGSTLSEAMSAHPGTFDGLLVGLTSAGEVTGRLPEVIGEMVASLKWQDDLSRQIRKALRYPAFVAAVITAVVFFLMIYLVPQLASFLDNLGQEMPLQTRALIAASDFVARAWPLLLGLPVLLLLGYRALMRSSAAARLERDRRLLTLPWLGEVVRKIALARFANTFALMFGSGIPVLDALAHCERAVGNLAVARSLAAVRGLVGQGMPISEAFAATVLFPPLVVRMVRVGEYSGQLDSSLKSVSYFYSRDVDEELGRLQSMIEPALTLVMGVILGWIMLAVLGPVYDTIANIPM